MSGRLEEAHRLMRRAIDLGLRDEHLFRALFDTGSLEKKLGLEHAALATFTDLTLSPNPYRARAYEELAKHYEHREKNFPMALECTRARPPDRRLRRARQSPQPSRSQTLETTNKIIASESAVTRALKSR